MLVLEIVLSGRVSVCVIVMVARIGFPVTTLPPKPPISPPNSNMPAIGPPGPGPSPLPKRPEGGGPCAPTTSATPANNIAAIPAPNIALFNSKPPQNKLQTHSIARSSIESTSPHVASHPRPPKHPQESNLHREFRRPGSQAAPERTSS